MDVAALGLAVDSSQVDKGTASLTKLTGAAKTAQGAASALAGSNRGAASAAAAAAASSNTAAAAMVKQAGAAQQLANSMRTANDNVVRMGGANMNTANIAAQFQDIAVSAQMGMGPMQIALQQGTQLAAVLNTMENPVKGLGQAFMSVLNPVSLVTIGLIGLAAAGLQMVDWTKLTQGVLRSVADSLQTIAPYAAAAAAGLVLLYAPAIISGLSIIPAALYAIETAMLAVLATIGWPALLITGIIALGGVAVAFRNDLTKYLGVDIVGAAKAGGNYLIQSFMVAYERIKTIWSQLPNMIEAAVTGAKNFFTGGSENPAADRVTEAMEASQARIASIMKSDPLADLGSGISSVATAVTSTLKGWANGLDDVDKKALKAAERARKNYAEIVLGANQFIAGQELERNAIGLTERATNRLRYEQELLNKAANDNIKLTPAQTAELKALAASMADAEAETVALQKAFDFAKDLTKGFVSDLRSGLEEGKGFWRSFGEAAVGVMDKIADKAFDLAIDSLFAPASGAGGGILGSVLGGISKMFGFANGGVFSQGNLTPFAKGGVVTRPTVFPMAKGAGLMGEAGPEAIMPLRRGPDGRLGVAAAGGAPAAAAPPMTLNFDFRGVNAADRAYIRQQVNAVLPQAVAAAVAQVPKQVGSRPGYLGSGK